MIDHWLAHPLGVAHFLAAVAALGFGTAVLWTRKGTARHRRLGRSYLGCMLALNGTALMIYELFGGFGPFHWMALASLLVIVAGYAAVRKRSAGWRERHAYFMVGSYVGLAAAAVAEVASRVPGWPFWISVIVSSLLVSAIGVVWMLLRVPRILETPIGAPAPSPGTPRPDHESSAR